MDRAEPAHMAMMKLADDHNDPPPPLPTDVNYLIGLDGGRLHAVRYRDAAKAALANPAEWRITTHSVCHRQVGVARTWGGYDRDNEHLAIHGACPECEWEVAVEVGTTAAVIEAMRFTGADRRAATKALGDPDLACRLYEAILANEHYDQEDPHTLQLLVHATRHAPVLLMSEECCDGDCEQHEDWAACRENSWFGCGACSVVAGSWAGEWAGQFATECTVAAPCAAFTELLTHYGIRPAGKPGDPAEPRLAAGMLVRQVWVEWAKEQPRPKLSWLLPWDRLDAGQQEVDMRIGEALWSAGRTVGLQEAALLANPLLGRP
jgi:hypothetical protein